MTAMLKYIDKVGFKPHRVLRIVTVEINPLKKKLLQVYRFIGTVPNVVTCCGRGVTVLTISQLGAT